MLEQVIRSAKPKRSYVARRKSSIGKRPDLQTDSQNLNHENADDN